MYKYTLLSIPSLIKIPMDWLEPHNPLCSVYARSSARLTQSRDWWQMRHLTDDDVIDDVIIIIQVRRL